MNTSNSSPTAGIRPSAVLQPYGSPVAKKIDDPYNLDEWQNHTKWFGETILGFLSARPIERGTIQRLLYLLKKANSRQQGQDSLELTIQVC